jgi:hypothetical protein
MARRDQGSGAVYFEHIKGSDCRDSKHHRSLDQIFGSDRLT